MITLFEILREVKKLHLTFASNSNLDCFNSKTKLCQIEYRSEKRKVKNCFIRPNANACWVKFYGKNYVFHHSRAMQIRLEASRVGNSLKLQNYGRFVVSRGLFGSCVGFECYFINLIGFKSHKAVDKCLLLILRVRNEFALQIFI